MNDDRRIAAFTLKSAVDLIEKEVDLERIRKLCQCEVNNVEDEQHWIPLDRWIAAAEEIGNYVDSTEELFFNAGLNATSQSMINALEFLPWFLSTPVLLLHNLDVIVAELDDFVKPNVEFVSRSRCVISFKSIRGQMPPVTYFHFLQGYLIGALQMWDSKITQREGVAKDKNTTWMLTIDWSPKEYRHRRALEELMVEPEFFSELYEGLKRIRHRPNNRLDELIKVSEQLRSEAPKAESHNLKMDTPIPGALKSRYLNLLTNVFDGTISIDFEGNIKSISDAAQGMLGFNSFHEAVAIFPDIISLTGIKNIMTSIEVQLSTGNPTEEKFFTFNRGDGMVGELLLCLPNKDLMNAEDETFNLIVRDPSFRAKYHIGAGTSRQFLEAIFLNNPSALQVIDTGGWTVKVNPQFVRMYKISADSLVGTGKYNILEDEFMRASGLTGALERALKGEHVVLNSFRMNSPGATFSSDICRNLTGPLVVNLTAFPLKDQTGGVYNVVVSYTDITESFLVQQQIAQLDKLKSIGTLASGIAHDFNNILGAIVPNADLIMHMANDNKRVQKKASAIKTAAKRAASLTQQLVSFGRENQSDMRLLDLNVCVREAVELIGNAIPKKVSIDFEPSEELPYVNADPLQMQQVLINLIINASDATIQGGIIEIKTRLEKLETRHTFGGNIIPPGEFVKLAVVDQGTGIPQEIIERVFDPFFTTKDKGRGTGLGLSVVHGIIKSHKGFIIISSEENQGTSFEVFLPVAGE